MNPTDLNISIAAKVTSGSDLFFPQFLSPKVITCDKLTFWSQMKSKVGSVCTNEVQSITSTKVAKI